MGWKNSPPAFSAVTETIADMCNARLEEDGVPPPHALDEAAAEVMPAIPDPPPPKIPQVTPTAVPVERDPCLPVSGKPLGTVDIFVDDFIALAQEYKTTKKKRRPALANSRRVRRILLHAIDDVFRPLDQADSPFRREPVSLKKLKKGDCSWSTVKEVLGWVINTVDMTIHLP